MILYCIINEPIVTGRPIRNCELEPSHWRGGGAWLQKTSISVLSSSITNGHIPSRLYVSEQWQQHAPALSSSLCGGDMQESPPFTAQLLPMSICIYTCTHKGYLALHNDYSHKPPSCFIQPDHLLCCQVKMVIQNHHGRKLLCNQWHLWDICVSCQQTHYEIVTLP